MNQKNILDLNHFCFYELLKQMKINCEKNNTSQTPEEIKYSDFISFIICHRNFRNILYEWDKGFYKSIHILYLSYSVDLSIDFAELYARLGKLSAKAKESYWKSLILAIGENDKLWKVELKYEPEHHYREHMEVFAAVMDQLRRKKSLRALRMKISGYSIHDLSGFGNLEELLLDAMVDIEELIKCCQSNKNLRDLKVMDSNSGGRRLAEITPYCNQVSKLNFKMKLDCDASQYAPLARMPRLEELEIGGEHEPGTLQSLFRALAKKEPTLLTDLSIAEVPLDFDETTALSQIKSLNNLKCGFIGPKSIEPISNLAYLTFLEILSRQDFGDISNQIYSILNSPWKRKTLSKDSLIDYDPKNKLRLMLNNVDASDYRTLLTLPRLKCLEINGSFKPGTLVKLFESLAFPTSTLIIETMNDFSSDFRNLLHKGWPIRPQIVPVINFQETAALSTCRCLKKLVCGFSNIENVELLSNLSELEELTIITKLKEGSLYAFFKALASREEPVLRYFELSSGKINSLEAGQLVQIRSLQVVECGFFDAEDIGNFSGLAKENLKELKITSHKFRKACPGILNVLQASEKEIYFSTVDITLMLDRSLKLLSLQMSIIESFEDDTLLVPLANIEWVEILVITIKEGSLKTFFKALSSRVNNHLEKIHIGYGSLDLSETQELVNMKSLREFRGTLVDPRSIEHLQHLTYIGIGQSFGTSFPKTVFDIFNSVLDEITISLNQEKISLNHKGLTVCSDFFSYRSKSAEDIAPLTNLKALTSVRILEYDRKRSLHHFLAQLATRENKTLQELIMESNSGKDAYFLNPLELKEVAAINSLRTLKCGFSNPEDLSMLAGLNQLNRLIVGFNQEGVLKALLSKLALNFAVPTNLPAKGQIEFDIRPNKISIPELIISKNQGDNFEEFFQMLVAASGLNLQRLTIKDFPINRNEAELISKIESLQRLNYSIENIEDIRVLLKLFELTTLIIGCTSAPMAYKENENLMTRLPDNISRDMMPLYYDHGGAQHLDRQNLVIELPCEVLSVKSLFDPLPTGVTPTLQELIITYRYLSTEEVTRIAEITFLKNLRCGIQNAISFNLLQNLINLESLEVKSYPKFVEISDNLVTCFQQCSKLQSIDLHFNPRVQFISADFLQRAIEVLKLKGIPKVRRPLKLTCFVSQVYVDPKVVIDEEYMSLSLQKRQEDNVPWICYSVIEDY